MTMWEMTNALGSLPREASPWMKWLIVDFTYTWIPENNTPEEKDT